MTNTKPHLEPLEAIDYLRFIPPALHQEATDFIVYVACKPYEKPTACPYCNSHSFHIFARTELTHYRCNYCRKTFSAITGTAFIGFHSHDLWEGVATLMLAGIHSKTFRENYIKLNSTNQYFFRERVLESIIKDDFPNLYQWWCLFRHQTGTPDVEMPPQVNVQYDQFQEWLQKLLAPRQVLCPRCQSQKCTLRRDRKNQACYICRSCDHKFSLLAPTRFRGLQHTSALPDVFNLIISGICHSEITIKQASLSIWRSKLMAQLRDLKLDLLADWIEWKRYCRSRQIKKELREQKKKI